MSVAPVGVKRIAFGKKKLLKNQGNGGFANSAVDTPVALPDVHFDLYSIEQSIK